MIQDQKHQLDFKTEKRMSSKLPYAYMPSPGVVVTKEQDLVATFKVKGRSIHLYSANQLSHIQSRLNQVLVSSGEKPEYSFNFHCLREHRVETERTLLESTFESNFESEYLRRSGSFYENAFYITIVQADASKGVSLVNEWLSLSHGKNKSAYIQKIDQRIEEFEDFMSHLSERLSEFRLTRLVHNEEGYHQSPLDFLSELSNLKKYPTHLPREEISNILFKKRVYVDADTLIYEKDGNIDKYAAVVSVRKYAASSYPALLDRVLHIDGSIIMHQFYRPSNQTTAIKKINKVATSYFQAESQASSNMQALEEAIDNIESGELGFGDHSISILCHSDTKEELNKTVSKIVKELEVNGFISIRETLNLESAWLSIFPGNFGHLNRKSFLSSKNMSDFMLFSESDKGHKGDNQLGFPLLPLKTESKDLYWFNYHGRSKSPGVALGHSLVLGASGAGKTTFLLSMDAAARKCGARSIIFDYALACAPYVLACGGSYIRFTPGEKSGINPIPQHDSPQARAFLSDFICSLVLVPQETPNDDDEKEISRVVNTILSSKGRRTFREMCGLFDINWDKHKRLSRWLEDKKGSLAYLFDSGGEPVDMDSSVVGFDLSMIKENEVALQALLTYLFYQVEKGLGGSPTSIIIDEGWQFLESPRWQKKLKEWLATLRKDKCLCCFRYTATGVHCRIDCLLKLNAEHEYKGVFFKQ